MIERHYAKYISTALKDLARAAVVPLIPRQRENMVGARMINQNLLQSNT
jgi:hypothetical protein